MRSYRKFLSESGRRASDESGFRRPEAVNSRSDRKQKPVARGFQRPGGDGNNAIPPIFSSRSAREVMQNPRHLSMKSRARRTVRREIFNLAGANGRSIRRTILFSAFLQDFGERGFG